MRLNGKIVFVPETVYDVVSENGLSRETMLNIGELTQFLNSETISEYIALNDYINQGNFVMGVDDNLGDLLSYRECLYPFDFINNSSTNDVKLISDNAIVILNELNSRGRYSEHMTVFSRMVGADVHPNNINKTNYVYELFNIKDDVFGVRLITSPDEYYLAPAYMLEKGIHLLYKQYKYEEIVKTNLFERWCLVTLRNF